MKSNQFVRFKKIESIYWSTLYYSTSVMFYITDVLRKNIMKNAINMITKQSEANGSLKFSLYKQLIGRQNLQGK